MKQALTGYNKKTTPLTKNEVQVLYYINRITKQESCQFQITHSTSYSMSMRFQCRKYNVILQKGTTKWQSHKRDTYRENLGHCKKHVSVA